MKITVNQLRRIIKEEVEGMTEAPRGKKPEPAPTKLDYYMGPVRKGKSSHFAGAAKIMTYVPGYYVDGIRFDTEEEAQHWAGEKRAGGSSVGYIMEIL